MDKCFLIDDDADDREIFALALRKAQADLVCTTAANGREAIIQIREGDTVPAYIFVDLNMPMISGKEVLAALKKIDRLKEVPIIAYTTSSLKKDVEDVKKLGAAHYLVKPTSFGALTSILTDIFNDKDLPFYIGDKE